MAQNKEPAPGANDPGNQDQLKSSPKKLRDLINRFSHHEGPPKREEPSKPKAPPPPPEPVEKKPEIVQRPAPAAPSKPEPKPAPEPVKKPALEKPKKTSRNPFRFLFQKTPPIPKPGQKIELPKKETKKPKAEPIKQPAPKKEPLPKKEEAKAPKPEPVKPAIPLVPKSSVQEPIKVPQPVPQEIQESWVYRNKKILIIVAVAAVALFFGSKFIIEIFNKIAQPSLEETMKQQQEAEKEAPVAVKGFKVGRFNYEDSLNVLGTIKGAMEVKLSFEIQGVVSSVNYMEGERYEEGALLISLRQDDILLRLKRAQAAFNKANSQAEVAETDVRENEKLLAMGAIPASTLEKKKLERDAARYEAETQRLEMKANEAMLEKSNLYAPSSGMLGELNIQEGESVSQNTLVGTHINTEYVYAEFGVVERDVQKISVGQKAKVFIDAYPDKTFDGVIENVAPQITGTSRTSTARVRIENPEGLLLPGMFARIRILLYSKKDALVVPTDAVQGGEGEKWVFVIKLNQPAAEDEALPEGGGLSGLAAMMTKKKAEEEKDEGSVKKDEGVVEKRPVTVGYTRPDYTQLDAGVTEGEIVVLTGFERLEDGKKIRLIETQEAEL